MGGMCIKTGKYLSEKDHIKQSIREIIITLKMTRIISRDFGVNHREIVDRSITPAISLKFKSEITRAVAEDEKRVNVEKVELSLTPKGLLIIVIASIKHNGDKINVEQDV